MSPVACRKSPIAIAVSAALFAAIPLAHAAAEPQLEAITVSGAREGSATYEAPTQGSLDAGEPQSIINQHFIENNVTAGANYTDIVNIAPSVSQITPNGPGNAEMLQMSIRGFQDGQFNVTFDGIPFNDSNDFTHHTTSYFTAGTVGKIVVDRGPGTAAEVGNGTFGGTVAVQSKDPMMTTNVSPLATIGTWNTNALSVQVDTGVIDGTQGGRAMVTLTDFNTAGAMSNNDLRRKNAMVKYVQPLGSDTTITAVAMYNTLHQNVSQFGTTLDNMAAYGAHFSLSQIPNSDSYYGYNFDDIHTDFEYIGVKTRWDGVRIDNKAYTYAYYHGINETNDTSLLHTGSGAAANNPPFSTSDVAGQIGVNNYRSWGDILRAEGEIGPGTLRGGLWFDYQWNDRKLYNVDWTLGGIPDASTATSVFSGGRYFRDDLTTIDPFIEYEFHPIEALTVTPGVRYASFKRDLSGPVFPNLTGPQSISKSYNSAQPSLYANYKVLPNVSVYAQWAKGSMAPKDSNSFATLHGEPDIGTENTNNLQAGGTWKADGMTISAALYHIKVTSFTQINGPGSSLTNYGDSTFKGAELEGTYALGYGVALYGNYTHNSQDSALQGPIQYAPDKTFAAGLIYDNHHFYASLITKYTGFEYQGVQAQPPNNGNVPPLASCGPAGPCYKMPGYSITNLSLGYTLAKPSTGIKDVKFRLLVSDLSNNQSIYYVYGNTTGIGTPQYHGGQDAFMTLPGRGYSFSLSADF